MVHLIEASGSYVTHSAISPSLPHVQSLQCVECISGAASPNLRTESLSPSSTNSHGGYTGRFNEFGGYVLGNQTIQRSCRKCPDHAVPCSSLRSLWMFPISTSSLAMSVCQAHTSVTHHSVLCAHRCIHLLWSRIHRLVC